MRLACISDVCLGYGSPQIGQLVQSLCAHYQAETLVIEPHRDESPPRHQHFPGLHIERAEMRFDPYTPPGRIEYLLEGSRLLNQYDPDILVVCCTFCLPVVFKLRKRPSIVIYYSLESIPFYGPFDMEMNRNVNDLVDLVIFPEENRAVEEVRRFGFSGVPKAVLFNCAGVEAEAPEKQFAPRRNGRVIYAGSIDQVATYGSYYTKPEAGRFPIDLFGPIRAQTEKQRQDFIGALSGQVRYHGYLGIEEVAEARKNYAYSIVAWNPSVENQLYAAPNKFFESIADGVPPIAAPHPQCKMLIDRYKCGILMGDWSAGEFFGALDRALRLYETDAWHEMVSNCATAVRQELTWDHQFEKLKVHLKDNQN